MQVKTNSVQVHELSLSLSEQPDSITLSCAGSADTRTSKQLEEQLRDVHAKAVARQLRGVVVDFQKLEFMNSSCFKSFVSWLSRVQALEDGSRYTIEFKSNPAFHWQSRSLQALSCFASDLVRVTA